MILCVGEILVDMIGKTMNGQTVYERKAGGAPFNVCAAINKSGGKSDFVGTVGDDNMGRFLLDFVSANGIDNSYIHIDSKHNTTLAFVELDDAGERSFCFYRKNTSDYHLQPLNEEMYKKYNIIHFGSLMLSSKEGIAYIKETARKAKENGVLLSFDINFRQDIFESIECAIEIYKDIIPLFDILKISSEEVEIFKEDYISSLTNKLIFISLGKQGSLCKYKGDKCFANTIVVEAVDTTGAGDAFFGATLRMLDGRDIDNLDKTTITDILKFANVTGALNTLGLGAIDNLPNEATIKEYAKHVI